MSSDKDRLYDEEITQPEDFVFDDRVVRVFPDMINRSVPAYAFVVPMIGIIARQYVRPGSVVYDLGCSLGSVALTIRTAIEPKAARIIAVDSSPAMVRALNQRLQPDDGIEVVEADLTQMVFEPASFAVSNFTLQFVSPDQRLPLLTRLADAMSPGDALILSEKVVFDDPVEQELQTHWYHEFKRAQGYSDLEIARKREALEDVLVPDSETEHRERLRQAGFGRVVRWFQGFSFASWVAVR